MNLSAEHLDGLAVETGFRPETLAKVIRQGELAADIGRHPLLSRVLALKGGTALNLLFGSPVRLRWIWSSIMSAKWIVLIRRRSARRSSAPSR